LRTRRRARAARSTAETAEPAQDGDGRPGAGAEDEPPARVEDAAVARDAAGGERREALLEELHHSIEDRRFIARSAIGFTRVLNCMHHD
jgi:hypothetical protein